MSLKTFKPLTPALRFLTQINYKNLFIKKKKLKSQCFNILRAYGRNNQGCLTSYHKGGGHKRLYRKLSYNLTDPCIVEGLEYDPYRSAFLMRVFNIKTKQNLYKIAPESIKKGDVVVFNPSKYTAKLGSSFFLKDIPLGTLIYNLNFSNSSSNKRYISNSAGTYSQIVQKTNKYCLVKLSSGQLRYLSLNSIGSYGRVSNIEHRLTVLGKAGRSRWLNKRPIVRGVAMNPIDHPHGGGQGKTSAGRPSVSPWGFLTKGGKKTRNLKKFNLNTK